MAEKWLIWLWATRKSIRDQSNISSEVMWLCPVNWQREKLGDGQHWAQLKWVRLKLYCLSYATTWKQVSGLPLNWSPCLRFSEGHIFDSTILSVNNKHHKVTRLSFLWSNRINTMIKIITIMYGKWYWKIAIFNGTRLAYSSFLFLSSAIKGSLQ